jgi:hypothetical protein
MVDGVGITLAMMGRGRLSGWEMITVVLMYELDTSLKLKPVVDFSSYIRCFGLWLRLS